MPINEDLADDFTARTVRLLRGTLYERRRVVRLLRQLQQDLIAELNRTDFGQRTETQQKRLRQLLETVAKTIRAAYKDISVTHTEQVATLATLEASWAHAAINKGIGVDLVALPSAEQIKTIAKRSLVENQPLENWWAKQAGDVQFRFEQVVRNGLSRGQTIPEMTKRVREEVEPYARRHAETLVRTSYQKAANSARMELYRANKNLIKSVQFLATLDTRTSPQCMSLSGLTWDLDGNPIGHRKEFMEPPVHHNAIAAGERVLTASGEKPIEQIELGEMVLTHRGRWRPVSAVMSKLNDTPVIRVLRMKSGRTLRMTNEHPILGFGIGWKRADEIKIGDKLFKDGEETMGLESVPVVSTDAYDCPSLLHEETGFDQVAFDPVMMPSAVDFENDTMLREGEVNDDPLDEHLMDEIRSRPLQQRQNGQFGGSDVFSLGFREARQHSLSNRWVSIGVFLFHALAMAGVKVARLFAHAVSPMIWPGRLAAGAVGQSAGGYFIPDRDVVLTAITTKPAVGQFVFPFNPSQRFSSLPVEVLNEIDDGFMIEDRSHFFLDEVIGIDILPYEGRVYNLSVFEDETYLVESIVTHNCRSTLVPITKSFRELGLDIDEIPPGKRAEMNGQVNAKTTFQQWLKRLDRKDPGAVTKMLGPTKAKLWREGKLSLRDLTDSEARPLRLDQL